MSDEEWETWQRAWSAGGRPLPKILKRARSDRMRAVVGLVFVWGIVLVQSGFALRALLFGHPEPITAASHVATIVAGVIIVTGVHMAMRGTLGQSGGDPVALLESMRARHRARRGIKTVLWAGTAFLVITVLGLAVWRSVEDGYVVAHLAGGVIPAALLVGLVIFVTRRVDGVMDRELREADEVERILREEDDAAARATSAPTAPTR